MFWFDKVYLICIESEKEVVFSTCYVVSTFNKQVRSDERLSTTFLFVFIPLPYKIVLTTFQLIIIHLHLIDFWQPPEKMI